MQLLKILCEAKKRQKLISNNNNKSMNLIDLNEQSHQLLRIIINLIEVAHSTSNPY
jgi:hypothetical protein